MSGGSKHSALEFSAVTRAQSFWVHACCASWNGCQCIQHEGCSMSALWLSSAACCLPVCVANLQPYQTFWYHVHVAGKHCGMLMMIMHNSFGQQANCGIKVLLLSQQDAGMCRLPKCYGKKMREKMRAGPGCEDLKMRCPYFYTVALGLQPFIYNDDALAPFVCKTFRARYQVFAIWSCQSAVCVCLCLCLSVCT